MYSAFLTSLLNIDPSFSQASVASGNIILDNTYTPYAYTGAEDTFNDLLYAAFDDQTRFARALQLTELVGGSPWWGDVFVDDPRITYTRRQVADHIGANHPGQPVAGLVAVGDYAPLVDTLPEVWRRRVSQAVAAVDRGLVVVTYFGRKAWL